MKYSAMGELWLFIQFLGYLTYRLVRFIFLYVRNIWWHLAGITEHLQDIRMTEFVFKSVHVQKIIYRQKWGNAPSSNGESEFVTLHHSFKDPEYIVKDHVTLYKVTKSSAIFVETKKDIIRNGKVLSKEDIFQYADKLIVLPLLTFHYIASQIKMPQRLALVGGGQLGETLPEQDHVTLSESQTLDDIFKLKKFLAPDQYFRMLQDAINIVCKSLHEKYTHVISFQGQSVSQVLDILHILPNTRGLFMEDFGSAEKLIQLFMKKNNLSCLETSGTL